MAYLYLHGFRSSPSSFKAQMLAARLRADNIAFFSPQLPASPKEAIAMVIERFRPGPTDVLIGSSLGGYYATYLAEHFGSRCVLLNPAVDPARGLAPYVGEQKMFHSDQAFIFKREYLQELDALAVPAITRPERYFLIAAKGDELLDWREMLEKYPCVQLKLLEGSDHGLSDFSEHIEALVQFATRAV
jgi:uncharacterized protein